jgi:M6 family metalloprotease-like protein
MITTLATFARGTGLHVDPVRRIAWIAIGDGNLFSHELGTGELQLTETGLPLADVTGDATSLVVVTMNGDVMVKSADVDGMTPVVVAGLEARPLQLALGGASGSPVLRAAVASAVGEELVQIRLATRTVGRRPVTSIAGVLTRGFGVICAVNDVPEGSGRIVRLVGQRRLPLVASMGGAVGRIALTGPSTIAACRPDVNGVAVADLASGTMEAGELGDHATGPIVDIGGHPDGGLLVLTTNELLHVPSVAELAFTPSITVPSPMFVASWAPILVDLHGTGLSLSEIVISVPDGPEAGIVSAATDVSTGDLAPLLVAGGRVGTYELEMRRSATDELVAATTFEVTDHWTDADTGPPMMISGSTDFEGGSGWGGGPNTPQNLGDKPHSGTWRVLALMVDTSTSRWPTSPPATVTANQAAVLGHITTGTAVSGQQRSARQYYEENSAYVAPTGGSPGRGLTLGVHNSRTYGPVTLPNAWTDYFAQTKDTAGNVTDTRWDPIASLPQTIVSRALSQGIVTRADLTAVDSIVFVVNSPDTTGSATRYVWPQASRGKKRLLLGTDPSQHQGDVAYLYVPLDFSAHDGRQMLSTLSHELGHNLGLADVYRSKDYDTTVNDKVTSDWEMMGGSRDTLPHFTISNKMRMGWVPGNELKLYNFQGAGGVSDTVTLHPAALANPPMGRMRGIEIRIGDGLNWYVEYHAKQNGTISGNLAQDRRVLITEVTSESFTAPIARPSILFVDNDADGDGRVIGAGADFDAKDPGTQMDLSVQVVDTSIDHATVKVVYGSNGKPDPGVRPWNGGPLWQSPDIEVRNDKTKADPGKWFNVPWAGHDNTVVVKVRNNGDLLAKGVQVDVYVTEFTSGDGPLIRLGSPRQDVAPGTTIEFSVPWKPPADESLHYCIVARVALYQDPANPAIIETNIYNNEARSNYTKFISASASPSTRVGTSVQLSNPFSETRRVHADVRQSHPHHRVFVDHTWRTVPGGSTSPIRVLDEAIYGTPEWEVISDGHAEGLLWELPNSVSVEGEVEQPSEAECRSRVLTGGCGLRVDAARATWIKLDRHSSNYVTGEVGFVDTGAPVTDGVVLIELFDGVNSFTVPTSVRPDGRFGRDFGNPLDTTEWIQAHFLGAFAAAEARSERLPPE